MAGIFAEAKKKLRLTRIQSNQNPNKDDKLFTQTYIEVTRLFSCRPDYELFEGTIRLIKSKII